MIFGKGTIFSWNGAAVAKLKNIGTPELTADSIDVTTHDSSGNIKQFVAGLLDAGSVPIDGFFDETDTAGQQAMFTDAAARATRQVIITGPSSAFTITFNAFITAIKLIGDSPVDGQIPFSATIKVASAPVYAVTSVVGMSAVAFDNDVLMMPAFNIAKYEYVVTITNAQTQTIITPTDSTSGEVITITANGASQVVTSGNPSTAIALSSTALTDIDVVISATGKTPKTYTFHCAVLAS